MRYEDIIEFNKNVETVIQMKENDLLNDHDEHLKDL
jgi:hypothetical protein